MTHHYEDIIPALFTLITVPIMAEYLDSLWISWVGVFVSALGLTLWWLGISARNKVKIRRPMMTTGIYKRVRHPIYSGAGLTIVGWVIVSSSWILFILALAVIFSLVVRVAILEDHLKKRYGDKFWRYKKKTWF